MAPVGVQGRSTNPLESAGRLYFGRACAFAKAFQWRRCTWYPVRVHFFLLVCYTETATERIWLFNYLHLHLHLQSPGTGEEGKSTTQQNNCNHAKRQSTSTTHRSNKTCLQLLDLRQNQITCQLAEYLSFSCDISCPTGKLPGFQV